MIENPIPGFPQGTGMGVFRIKLLGGVK